MRRSPINLKSNFNAEVDSSFIAAAAPSETEMVIKLGPGVTALTEVCDECGAHLAEGAIEEHKRSEHTRPFEHCQDCGADVQSLYTHKLFLCPKTPKEERDKAAAKSGDFAPGVTYDCLKRTPKKSPPRDLFALVDSGRTYSHEEIAYNKIISDRVAAKFKEDQERETPKPQGLLAEETIFGDAKPRVCDKCGEYIFNYHMCESAPLPQPKMETITSTGICYTCGEDLKGDTHTYHYRYVCTKTPKAERDRFLSEIEDIRKYIDLHQTSEAVQEVAAADPAPKGRVSAIINKFEGKAPKEYSDEEFRNLIVKLRNTTFETATRLMNSVAQLDQMLK